MFGKFFAQAFEGSMYGAGDHVFSVWVYAIANSDRTGRVELNPLKLRDTIGSTVERMEGAIEYLCSPDVKSRCQLHEGRRLVKEGVFQYFIPSYEIYRNIKKAEDLALSNARHQKEHRERVKVKRFKKGTPLPGETTAVQALGNGDESTFNSLSEPRVAGGGE